jgi:hypothetical protein
VRDFSPGLGPDSAGQQAGWNRQGRDRGVQQGISVALSIEGNTALMGGIGDNSNTGAGWVFIVPSLQVTPHHRCRRRNQGSKNAVHGSIGYQLAEQLQLFRRQLCI